MDFNGIIVDKILKCMIYYYFFLYNMDFRPKEVNSNDKFDRFHINVIRIWMVDEIKSLLTQIQIVFKKINSFNNKIKSNF